MKFYAFKYTQKKLYTHLVIALNNTAIALCTACLSYCLIDITAISLFQFDLTDYFIPYITVLTAGIIILLEMIYYLTKKGVILSDKEITVRFGFLSPGSHKITKKLDIQAVKEVSIDTGFNDEYGKGRWDVYGGNYKEPYIKIYFGKNNNYILPIESAEDFLTEWQRRAL